MIVRNEGSLQAHDHRKPPQYRSHRIARHGAIDVWIGCVEMSPIWSAPLAYAQRLRWRCAQGFMDTAEIVMRDVQRNRCEVVIKFL